MNLKDHDKYIKIYNEWLDHSEGWMKEDLISLKRLPEKDFYMEVEERFSVTADFGTGGLRNIIRAGLNGINDYWIRRICIGMSKTLKNIVIAFDTRNKSDHFAQIAATELASNNCRVFLFDSPVPTPLLSFAVKKLNCDAGIVITASHNPKEYNGFKVYDNNGVQYTPEKVERLKNDFQNVPFINTEKKIDKGDITKIGEDFYTDYFDLVFKELEPLKSADFKRKPVSVIYSALHGTGARFVPKIMREYGIEVIEVSEQMIGDGNFPTVNVPNPENPDTFSKAIEMTKEITPKPQLLLATDPDADRLGVFVFNGIEYTALNGNELGMLLLDFIVSSIDLRNKNLAVLKTIVTTDMAKVFSQQNDLDCFETLTGFKFLGAKVLELKKMGIETLFSFEESFGYLYGEHAGDKDACSTSGLLALLLNRYETGTAIINRLLSLRKTYGFYKESLCSCTSKGIDGSEKMEQFISFLRKTNPDEIWHRKALLKDYNEEPGELKANVLEFVFDKNEKVIFRPSGTEPKIKAYLSVNDKSEELSDKKITELEKVVKRLFERL